MKPGYQELQSRLTAVQSQILQAREKIAAGNFIDLNNIGLAVQQVFDLIQSEFKESENPNIDHPPFAQQLKIIIADLDELKQVLIQEHAANGGTIAPEDSETD